MATHKGRKPSPLGRLLFVSPHLDDAVFGCGELIAAQRGCVVATVFASRPAQAEVVSHWDALAGFTSSEEAIRVRREEDRNALAILGARPLWLRFPPGDYQPRPPAEEIADALLAAADQEQIDTLFVPLGTCEPDHQRTHEGALTAMARSPVRNWFAYEDAVWRRHPGAVQERLARLHAQGVAATPVAFRLYQRKSKRLAVQCYASQLRALAAPGQPGHLDALLPEGYWHLSGGPG